VVGKMGKVRGNRNQILQALEGRYIEYTLNTDTLNNEMRFLLGLHVLLWQYHSYSTAVDLNNYWI